jgi:LPXTG-motif cell wall-anchored protein
VAGRWGRLAAATGVGAMMTLGMSGVALADPATGTVKGDLVAKVHNKAKQHKLVSVTRILFKPKDGAPVLAFCVDLGNALGVGDTYTETSPADSGVQNLDKVTALLAHSLPAKTVDEVAAAVNLPKPSELPADDLAAAIYAGTQAAIWHTVDAKNFELTPLGAIPQGSPVNTKAYKVIAAVYDYLLGTLAKPALAIEPASANGKVGDKAGPFTVKSSGVGDTALTATGGVLVDAAGKAVTKLANDGKFWVDCKADGTVTIKGTAKYKLPNVKVFKGSRANSPSASAANTPKVQGAAAPQVNTLTIQLQTIIAVDVVTKELAADAKAVCAKATTPALPVTGAPVAGTIAAGVVLLGAGAGLFLVRRRRVSFTA